MMKLFFRAMLLMTMMGSATFVQADSFDRAVSAGIQGFTDSLMGKQDEPKQNAQNKNWNQRQPARNSGNAVWNRDYNPPASFRATADVNYRSCAGKGCAKIGTMRKGTIVTVRKMVKGWYQITLEPGQYQYGYVYKQYLTPTAGQARNNQWKRPAAKRPVQRRSTQRADSYVAIAFSDSVGSSFTIWGDGTTYEGNRQAINGCNRETNGRNDCKIVISGSQTCASLAAAEGEYGGYDFQVGTDNNRRSVERTTLRDCRRNTGQNCELLSTKCSWDPH